MREPSASSGQLPDRGAKRRSDSLATGRWMLLADDGQHVALAQNQILLTVDRHFGPTVLPVEDLVADLHVHRDALVLLEAARANRDDLALLGLLLRGVRDV